MNAVGIDVSKGKSMVAIIRPYGEIVSEPQEVRHTSAQIDSLIRQIKSLEGDTRIVMEHTGRYHEPMAQWLSEAGLFVSAVNPKLIKDFGSGSLRKVKTDKADAVKIGITQDQAKKEKERYLKLFRFPDEAFLKWLDSKSLTMEDAELYFKNKLILKRFYEKKFGAKKIPDEEAREYYKVNNEYYNRPAKIALSHILICHVESQGCKSDLSKVKAKELAESIRKSITPENFAEKAKRYSFDSTGQIGGSLGVITKGSAIPSLDKAAFSLKIGEISDPVESEHGYHILYITNKAEELSIPFEETRESIEYTLEEEHITLELLKYAEQIKKNAKIIKYSETDRKGSPDLKDQANIKKSTPPVKQYSTFKATGKDILRNSKGQPVIIMFSHIRCSFCKWIEETFDDTVMDYIKKGLIEAHHYDIQTKDDLLTPETETSIPEQYLKLFDHENPNSSTPCFNFGGMYFRLGVGYFDQDDLYAEEMEMRQIIEDLIRY